MAMHPDSSFPLLASDQAEIIRIFLELMREHESAEHPSEVISRRPPSALNERGGWFADEQLDSE
jgi:hypothetical protein